MLRRVSNRYHPHEYQIRLHKAFPEFRKRAAVTGSRGGKTTGGVADVGDKLILQPGFRYEDIDAGEPYTVVVSAPTHQAVQTLIFPALQRWIPDELKLGPYHGGKRLQRIRGKKGETHLYYLSAGKPEAWQGMKLYGVWIDEFPLVKEQMYDEALVRLSDRNGWILLTGTPRGPNWAKKRIYDAWLRKEDPEIFFTTWKTIDNPFIDRQFIETMRRVQPPKFFKRAFEASWDVFQGQIYEEFSETVHRFNHKDYTFILPGSSRRIGDGPKKIRLTKVVAGVDWGFGPEHPGVILVAGRSGDMNWWVLDESVAEGVLVNSSSPTADSWVKRARTMKAKWEVERFHCDHSAENMAQFNRAKLRATPAAKNVLDGIQTVARFLHIVEEEVSGVPIYKTGLRISSECRTVLDEIVYYHHKEGSEEPEKTMDHTMDALRYLLHTEVKRGTFYREKGWEPAPIGL